MKIISWNLNGLLASIKNGVMNVCYKLSPDILCLQEIRTQQEPSILQGYHHFWHHGQMEGYSGTAILTKKAPLSVSYGFRGDFDDDEGRIMTVELEAAYVVNVYVPNSQKNLKRHAYRLAWDSALREYIAELMEMKPVILCGDFNVAREQIDIYEENMHQYWAEQGLSSDERSDFETLLEEGLVDVFRAFYPDRRGYTWWSNRLNKRKENRGWRLDYFLVSEDLMEKVEQMAHLESVYGSDHCPIMLEVQL